MGNESFADLARESYDAQCAIDEADVHLRAAQKTKAEARRKMIRWLLINDCSVAVNGLCYTLQECDAGPDCYSSFYIDIRRVEE